MPYHKQCASGQPVRQVPNVRISVREGRLHFRRCRHERSTVDHETRNEDGAQQAQERCDVTWGGGPWGHRENFQE